MNAAPQGGTVQIWPVNLRHKSERPQGLGALQPF